MKPYEYHDPGCDARLEIRPCLNGGDARVTIDGARIYEAPADVPAVARALYEAAGLPAPLILDRPETGTGTSGRNTRVGTWSVWLEGTRVRIEDYSDGLRGVDSRTARLLAAVIAACAEAPGREPGTGEAHSLAMALHEGGCPGGGTCTWSPAPGDLRDARAALAAGWTRAPEQDTR